MSAPPQPAVTPFVWSGLSWPLCAALRGRRDAIRLRRMEQDRRSFIAQASAAAFLAGSGGAAAAESGAMYGLIGKMTAQAGRRDELIAILLESVGGMPGCLSYVVAADPADGAAIWITEVWDSKESHAASLQLPAVQDVIRRARPLIAGMETIAETAPAGGHGLPG